MAKLTATVTAALLILAGATASSAAAHDRGHGHGHATVRPTGSSATVTFNAADDASYDAFPGYSFTIHHIPRGLGHYANGYLFSKGDPASAWQFEPAILGECASTRTQAVELQVLASFRDSITVAANQCRTARAPKLIADGVNRYGVQWAIVRHSLPSVLEIVFLSNHAPQLGLSSTTTANYLGSSYVGLSVTEPPSFWYAPKFSKALETYLIDHVSIADGTSVNDQAPLPAQGVVGPVVPGHNSYSYAGGSDFTATFHSLPHDVAYCAIACFDGIGYGYLGTWPDVWSPLYDPGSLYVLSDQARGAPSAPGGWSPAPGLVGKQHQTRLQAAESVIGALAAEAPHGHGRVLAHGRNRYGAIWVRGEETWPASGGRTTHVSYVFIDARAPAHHVKFSGTYSAIVIADSTFGAALSKYLVAHISLTRG